MGKEHITREQIIRALEVLGLDPMSIQSVFMDLDSVVITEKRWVTVSREEKIAD